jgi:hypothetical protein
MLKSNFSRPFRGPRKRTLCDRCLYGHEISCHDPFCMCICRDSRDVSWCRPLGRAAA